MIYDKTLGDKASLLVHVALDLQGLKKKLIRLDMRTGNMLKFLMYDAEEFFSRRFQVLPLLNLNLINIG